MTIEDSDHYEQRFVTLGLDAEGNLLVVVYTYLLNGDAIRIISTRKANRIDKAIL
ncbi:BrnT family toxin [Candidiatus Paracoxiella cheracis]|uniref:BrnT family toxin n=1 Tax=Candidiatus Paracoxiella cheracis TaxID=3405120 RepID=UPI003BF49977